MLKNIQPRTFPTIRAIYTSPIEVADLEYHEHCWGPATPLGGGLVRHQCKAYQKGRYGIFDAEICGRQITAQLEEEIHPRA